MNSLPFLIPENDDRLNLAIILLAVYLIGSSKRGRPLMNNERLQIITYLVKNPVVMNKVLARLGMPGVELDESEANSVSSIAVNLDPLFDGAHLKFLLRYAASLGYINVSYRKSDGFMYLLTDVGKQIAAVLDGDYFCNIRKYLAAIGGASTLSNSDLMAAIRNEIGESSHV